MDDKKINGMEKPHDVICRALMEAFDAAVPAGPEPFSDRGERTRLMTQVLATSVTDAGTLGRDLANEIKHRGIVAYTTPVLRVCSDGTIYAECMVELPKEKPLAPAGGPRPLTPADFEKRLLVSRSSGFIEPREACLLEVSPSGAYVCIELDRNPDNIAWCPIGEWHVLEELPRLTCRMEEAPDDELDDETRESLLMDERIASGFLANGSRRWPI